MFRRQRRKNRQAELEERENKQWAREYILDPLTAPEPSQECGPGSSFISARRRSLGQNIATLPFEVRSSKFHRFSKSLDKRPAYPKYSPLASPAPSIGRFSFEDVTPCIESRYPNEPPRRPQPLVRSHSHASTVAPPETSTIVPRETSTKKNQERPQPTHSSASFGKYPPRTSVTRVHSENQLLRSPNVTFPKDQSPPPSPMATPKPSMSRSNSFNNVPATSGRPRRSSSLSQRYPGDMSHRPLEILRREARTADRSPYVHAPAGSDDHTESAASSNTLVSRKNSKKASRKPFTDTIDRLDHTALGGAYHHGGPYDAALASSNVDPMYAPIEAVKNSNTEALKATPRDRVIDSVTHHMPLHGTAALPPGMADPRTGEVLNYEEGTDLMREPDAAGGAYKRWDGVQYLDEDLKGKGEPSYTIEKHLKESKRNQKDRLYPPQAHKNNTSVYEMQPSGSSSALRRSGSVRSTLKKDQPTVAVRRRSNSAAADAPRDWSTNNGHFKEELSTPLTEKDKQEAGLSRSNSRGGFGEGLKRRFGSLRKKN